MAANAGVLGNFITSVLSKNKATDADLSKLFRSMQNADDAALRPLLDPANLAIYLSKVENEGTCEAACAVLAKLMSDKGGRRALRETGAIDALLSQLLRQTGVAKGERQQDRMLAIGRLLALAMQDASRTDVDKVAVGLVGQLYDGLAEFQASNFRKTTAAAASVLIFLRIWSHTNTYARTNAAAAAAAAAPAAAAGEQPDAQPDVPPVVAKVICDTLVARNCVGLLIQATRGALAPDAARRGIADNALLMVFNLSMHHPETLQTRGHPGFDAMEYLDFLAETGIVSTSITTQEHALMLLVRMAATLKVVPSAYLYAPKTLTLFRTLLAIKSPSLSAVAIVACGILPTRAFMPLAKAYENACSAVMTLAAVRLRGPFGDSAAFYYRWFGRRVNPEARALLLSTGLLNFIAENGPYTVPAFFVRLMPQELQIRLACYIGYDPLQVTMDGSPVDPEHPEEDADEWRVDGSTPDRGGALPSYELPGGSGNGGSRDPSSFRPSGAGMDDGVDIKMEDGGAGPSSTPGSAGGMRRVPSQQYVGTAGDGGTDYGHPGVYSRAGGVGTGGTAQPRVSGTGSKLGAGTSPTAGALPPGVLLPADGGQQRRRTEDGMSPGPAHVVAAAKSRGPMRQVAGRTNSQLDLSGLQGGGGGSVGGAADDANLPPLRTQEGAQSKRQLDGDAAAAGGLGVDAKRARRGDANHQQDGNGGVGEDGAAAGPSGRFFAGDGGAANALNVLAAAAEAASPSPLSAAGGGGTAAVPRYVNGTSQGGPSKGCGTGGTGGTQQPSDRLVWPPPGRERRVSGPGTTFTHIQLQQMMLAYQGLSSIVESSPEADESQRSAVTTLAQVLSNVADVAEVKHMLFPEHQMDINQRLDNLRIELQGLHDLIAAGPGALSGRLMLEAKVLRALSVMMKHEVEEQVS